MGSDYEPGSAEDFRRTPPSDITAEQWLLGGAMSSPAAMAEVVELLEPDDFYRPAHGMIYLAMVTLWAQGIPLDPITVKAELEARGDLAKVGGPVYLADLYGLPVLAPAVVHHAQRVRDLAARRQVIEAATRLHQRCYAPGEDLADLVIAAQAEVARAVMTAAAARGHGTGLADLETYAKRNAARQPAVIPGLLDHQDRAVLVGYEGDGKSTLGLQVLFGAAAGVHPFVDGCTFAPQRGLIVDLETPEYLLHRLMRRMDEWVAAKAVAWHPRNVTVLSLPGGLDLTRASDAMRLADTIRLAQPDLVMAGPVYKMLVDRGQGAEQLHSQVANFWDTMRARYGCAVWLETHPPGPANGGRRELRPYGWSGWMRWPEFGLVLDRGRKGDMPLNRFRGDREEGRMWPVKLRRNQAMRPCAPWAAIYADGTFQGRLDDSDEEGGQ